jgi:hypothetical protein
MRPTGGPCRTADQAAGIWPLRGIFLYDATRKDGELDLIVGQPIRHCFLIGMIGDSHPSAANCVLDVLNRHLSPPRYFRTYPI